MNFILNNLRFILISVVTNNLFVHCDVTISYSPSSLRFGSTHSLYMSDLDNLIGASLGYSVQFMSWPGLIVTSPFKYPKAAVVFGVKDGGVPVRMEGQSYELKEDQTLEDIFDSVSSLIRAGTQRPVHIQNLKASSLPGPVSLPKTEKLNEEDPTENDFLEEMSLLTTVADFVKSGSSIPDGQDTIFVDVDNFAPLVKKYGTEHAKVIEATRILRAALVQAIDELRKLYADRLVVYTLMLSQDTPHVRRVRDTPLFSEAVTKNTTKDYNLAAVYSDDFPVIFNIILFLSIILVVAVLFASVSMAFMDPGRDSIIYRMTNPRMKKDQ